MSVTTPGSSTTMRLHRGAMRVDDRSSAAVTGECDQLGEELAGKTDRVTGRIARASAPSGTAPCRCEWHPSRLSACATYRGGCTACRRGRETRIPVDHRSNAVGDARGHAEMRLVGRHDDRQLAPEAFGDHPRKRAIAAAHHHGDVGERGAIRTQRGDQQRFVLELEDAFVAAEPAREPAAMTSAPFVTLRRR